MFNRTGSDPNQPAVRDWGLSTQRVSENDASPLTLTHRYGVPSIPAYADATMIYALFRLDVAAHLGVEHNAPLNLALVLDQSLSMRGEKMDRVKEAARYVADQLGPPDTLAVVSFNDRATLVAPAQTGRDTALLKEQINAIRAARWHGTGGRHSHGPGSAARAGQQRNAVSAMLLLTDGRTYGDEAACMQLAEEARRLQFVITPLGVGEEWNEDLLEALAYRSGSHSEYIDRPEAIVAAFQAHVEVLQATYGRDAQLIVEPHEGVRLAQVHRTAPLIGRVEVAPGGRASSQTFLLGSLHGGEDQEFLLELVAQQAAPGEVRLARLQLLYEPVGGAGVVRRVYELTIPAVAAAGPAPALDGLVKMAVEKVVAYKLQQKAWQDLNEGNLASATQRLRMVATRLIDAGEEELARTVQAEADHLERTGQTSPTGTKQIKYGTRGLGRTQAMRLRSGLLGRETLT